MVWRVKWRDLQHELPETQWDGIHMQTRNPLESTNLFLLSVGGAAVGSDSIDGWT